MRTVNMLEAKTHFSKLVSAIESGAESEIIVARNGRPTVRILPMASKRGGMLIGLAEGEFKAPKDLDAYNEEVAGVFEQSRIFPDE
jgi:antitoxin (DNA-binding transcriptional repressor) of toxin-antitoxin stability system